MSLLGSMLPGWANDILGAAGKLVARRAKAKVDEEIARDKLARDAARDNAEFAEERARREVETGKAPPK